VAKDLQTYLAIMAEKYPEELITVQDTIDQAQHEVSAYIELLEDKRRFPIVLFEHVKNINGEQSKFPLVHNLFATRSLCARAIGLDPSNYRMALVKHFGELQGKPIDYEVIRSAQAPVMENTWTGEQADITLLPAARYHEKDAGPYFVMACLMKGKTENFYNVTLTKNMVQGPAPIAVVLGHHPAFYLGSCALSPYGNDDYRTIGGYLGEPLRLAPSASLGDDFLIPADAEIVIEGLVPPGVRKEQNPFGEISGHYQELKMFPVVEVQAICYRDKAIMEGILPAHSEHCNLGGIPKEGSVFNAIRRVVPGVKGISLPVSGKGRFSCYISLKKATYRDVQVAAMVAFSEMPNLKVAVVVDEDIDVFDETEVLWAAATQVYWDRDLVVIPKVQSVRTWLGDAVAIIDATRPEDVKDFPERNRIPEDTLNRIKRMFENLR